MLLFIALLAGLGFMFALAATPHALLRLAYWNAFRLDGSLSLERRRREVRHLLDFIGNLLLVPVLTLFLFAAPVALVHYYVVPIPLVLDIFEAFDPDPVRWEHAIEKGKYGDLGVVYEDWRASNGFSMQSARFWQEFLWTHWLSLLLLGVGGACFSYWFLTHYYLDSVTRYGKGVHRRRGRYRRADALKRKEDPTSARQPYLTSTPLRRGKHPAPPR